MSETLLEHIKDYTSIPEALEAASAWMMDAINAALHAHGEGRPSPIIKAADTSEGGQIAGDSPRADLPAHLEPSRFFASCLSEAAKTLHACQPKEEQQPQDGPRPAAVMYLFPACTQQIQEAFEQYSQDPHRKKSTLRGLQAAALVAESTNKVIEKYLDVMVALDLIGEGDKIKHIHTDLLNAGQTERDGKTHDDVINRIKSLKVIKKDEDEDSVRLLNNLYNVISQYVEVGEALGLIGHDRGLVVSELVNDGKTKQIGKTHKDVMRKIKNLRGEDRGHVEEDALLSLREKCQELETDVAVWRYELIDIAKNLGVIDDSPIKDSDAAKTIGPSVGAKCYEMRTKIKQCETELATLTQELNLERDRSTRMQNTINEQRSALNNANQQIEHLRTEITKGHEANTKLALEMQYRSTAAHQGAENTARNYKDALRIIGELYIENRHLKTQASNE